MLKINTVLPAVLFVNPYSSGLTDCYEFHLNTYRPTLVEQSTITVLELDFASLYEDRRTFFAYEMYKSI